MGNLCSSPADKYEAKAGAKGGGKGGAQHGRRAPDFGMAEHFEIDKLLGTGGEGETYLAKDKVTKEVVAIKLVKRPLPKTIIPIVTREIQILAELGDGHLNIVHATEVILTKTHLGLIMEYMPGGNMVDYVQSMRRTRDERGGLCISEEEGRYFFIQLINAVQFCHAHKVAHRDLKLDNTLIDSKSPPHLKLCDFGFAKSWGAQSTMDTMRIGTPEYMGPELIAGRTGYDGKKVDVWASGVLLFVMLLGMFPFEFEDPNYVNTAGLYGMWAEQMKSSWRDHPANAQAVALLSPECKDLLDKMFEIKQEKRISMDGIRSHPWYTKPLAPKYAKQLASMAAQQAKLDAGATEGKNRCAERDRALKVLIEKATLPPPADEKPIRVSLSILKQPKYDFVEAGGGGAIEEGDEEAA